MWNSNGDFTTAKEHLNGKRLPQINIGDRDLRILTDRIWKALLWANDPPYLFRAAGELCRIETDDKGEIAVRPLSLDRLRHEMARVAEWYFIDKEGELRVAKPPLDVAKDVLATPDPPFPVLTRTVEVPVFAPDGSLSVAAGYNAASQVYYLPTEGLEILPVSESPEAADIQFARELVLDTMFGEFPFISVADCAHAVALFLLPFARDLISGPTPNHLFESPMPGTGKGLLTHVCLAASVGTRIGVITQAHNGEEWRKRLTATFREAHTVVIIDNVTRPLDSGELAAALTATVWTDRLLAKNLTITAPVRCVWVTTANNPTMSTEMARRTIRIRLDSSVARPWTRTGFQIPDLVAWTRDMRPMLIWAAHTLIQAWLAAGRPNPECPQLGSYTEWRTVIGGILQNAEIIGFLSNLSEFYEVADFENATLSEFVAAWHARHGQREVGAAELFQLVAGQDWFELTGNSEQARRTSFGKQLARYRDRIVGSHRIAQTRSKQHAKRWMLLPLETSQRERREGP